MLNKLLDRTVSVTMIVLLLLVLGIVSIRSLPVGLIPDIDIPQISVQITAPDMSAREIDEVAVKPLRQSLMQIDKLKGVHSESKDGSAVITLSFDEGQNADFFYVEVNEKVDRAMGSLPHMERPKVFKASATDIPAFFISVTLKEGGDFLQLSSFVRDVISRRIEQLDEVAMVDITACLGSEILVVPDQDKLQRLGIGLTEFQSYVNSANVNLSNLTIRDDEYHYNVRFQSFAASAEDIAEVCFKVGDRVLRIKDVATVREQAAPRTGLALSGEKEAVVLAVIKQSEARMADLKKAIALQLDSFSEDYPQMDFSLTRDQTELLEYSINNLLLNIALAILLVCIVIVFFMKDFRSAFLVALSIPVSLVISFFIFKLIGLTINIISLSGLLLGVGMMVDNSIVLVDNITARWQRGDALRTAVVEGTSEMTGAMLSSVLTTCAVFVPLVFLNGLAGAMFFDQAVSISVVLLVAYAVTVIVLPVYYWALYRRRDCFKPVKLLNSLKFGRLKSIYDSITDRFLSNSWIVWAAPLLSIIIIVLCYADLRREKLPPITYTDAILNIDWNEHLSLEANSQRVLDLQNLVSGECTQFTSLVGTQQFALRHSPDLSSGEASLYFKCRDEKTLKAVKGELDSYVKACFPRAVCSFDASGNIFDMVFSSKEPQLLVHLRPTGPQGLQVQELESFLDILRDQTICPEIAQPALKEDVLFVSDPELMTLYGVGMGDLTAALRNSLNANTLFVLTRGNRSVPVVLGNDVKELSELLGRTMIEARLDGKRVDIPASALMRQSFERDFKTIVSSDEGNYYPVEFNVKAGRVPELMASIKRIAGRDGRFDVSFSGAYFSNKALVRQMSMILLLALLLLFLILASQFESLIQPLIILSEIIIDIAACMLVLLITNVSINIMSLIGLVVVSGIVINDSILKIDTINRLVRSGAPLAAAIHEAGHRRLKAILMTTITTVLAVAPFLGRGNMGSDLQFPMALVVIVGMTVGTLVSLFYVPAFYSLIYKKRRP